jgi:hypothetical protein
MYKFFETAGQRQSLFLSLVMLEIGHIVPPGTERQGEIWRTIILQFSGF